MTADTIIRNGKVATGGNTFAAAAAIKDGRFVAVGTEKDVQPYRGEKTEVIDANGRTVIPGLYYSHLHLIRGGLN